MITSRLTALPGSKRSKTAAFTLIELLVVISIIAILAGILLPVIGGVTENAKKVDAKSTETQIVSAVKNFQTEYGVYPNLPSTTAGNPPKDITVGGNVSSNAELFNLLRAIDPVAGSANTRRISYFDGKDVKISNKPKDGFATVAGTGNNSAPVAVGDLVDPWGNVYFVCYDSGYSDQVNHPYATTPSANNDDGGGTYSSATMLRTGVIAWSYGKDGMKGKGGTVTGTAPSITSYGDDVVSWQ